MSGGKSMRMSMSTVITIMTIVDITILDYTMVVWRRAKPVERRLGGIIPYGRLRL